MDRKIIEVNNITIVIIHSNELVITNTQSALDLMATIMYDNNCERIAINKEAINEDFFNLRTGIAGEILQKFVNYSKKLAIIGDFSICTSEALRDFIYESNNGNDIFFVADEQTAVNKLAAVL